MFTRMAVLTTTLVVLGSNLEAQRLSPAPMITTVPTVSFRNTDYRWEGAIFGAAVTGLTVAIIEAGSCRTPDEQGGDDCTSKTLTGGLIGAASGAVIGYLVGTAIKKS